MLSKRGPRSSGTRDTPRRVAPRRARCGGPTHRYEGRYRAGRLRGSSHVSLPVRPPARPAVPAVLAPVALFAFVGIFGCGGVPASSTGPMAAIPTATSSATTKANTSAPADLAHRVVDAPDRSADDRALDAGRRPAELLSFLGIRPGMRVGEIIAGTGYTTELLARAVGTEGKVYGQIRTTALSANDSRKKVGRRGSPSPRTRT